MAHRYIRSFLPALVLAGSLGACAGSLRVVRRAQGSGEVALVGDQEDARAQAEDYMRRQCPEGHDVLDEGEAVVGSQSLSTFNGYGRRGGVVNTTTSDVNEWRIRYQCKDDPAATAATVPVPRPGPPPPAPAPPRERAPAAPSAPAPAASSAPSTWAL